MNQQVKMVLIMDSDGSVKRTKCGFYGIFSDLAIYLASPLVAPFNLALSAGKILKRSAATK